MRVLLDKSRRILKLWEKEHNIREISDLMGLTYDAVRNNYFKKFWKKGYLDRVSYGRYILNERGKKRIDLDLKIIQSREKILELGKKKFTNAQIKKEIKDNFGLNLTDSSIFSRIHLLKKEHYLKNRRIKEISIPLDEKFYGFLGLILSDGYIGEYNVAFYNKDSKLLSYYEGLMESWNQNFLKRIRDSGVYEISVYSIRLVSFVNKFLNNKKHLSRGLLEAKKVLQTNFLRGFYSGDGSVFFSLRYRKKYCRWYLEPRISLAVFNKRIMEDILLILNNLGYSPKHDGNNINLNKKKDIRKFFREIGFIEGGKISGSRNYNGFSKNQMLKYVANKMEGDEKLKYLLNEDSKEQIINHIKSGLSSM